MTGDIKNYAQQAQKPDFFESNETSIFVKCTAGSSPFNEWYEFKDRDEAVNFIANLFSSQSFLDKFVQCGDEFYGIEDCMWNPENEDELIPKPDSEVADIAEMCCAESRF